MYEKYSEVTSIYLQLKDGVQTTLRGEKIYDLVVKSPIIANLVGFLSAKE